MSCCDPKQKGIGDEEHFWVRIHKTGCDWEKGFDFDVVEVRRTKELTYTDDVEKPTGRNMDDLPDFCEMLKEHDEVITFMKSVEIHMVRVQKKADLPTENNRTCVVNKRKVRC